MSYGNDLDNAELHSVDDGVRIAFQQITLRSMEVGGEESRLLADPNDGDIQFSNKCVRGSLTPLGVPTKCLPRFVDGFRIKLNRKVVH